MFRKKPRKRTNWKLIGGIAVGLAALGVAAYLISKNDEKDAKSKKRTKK